MVRPRRIAAIFVTTCLGAVVGLIAGYLTSGYVGMSAGFYYWITYPIDSWHWPILGALAAGLSSLALQLWVPDRRDGICSARDRRAKDKER